MNNDYYGISSPNESFIAHYGVKGMKWGVRKAIEKGDIKKLAKHYSKAQQKYKKLVDKADIAQRANNAYAHRAISRGALAATGIQGGLSGALIAENGLKKALPMAAFFTGPVAATAGIARINYALNKNKMTSKGHNKAVQKVKNWESQMNKAFKRTKYSKDLKNKKFSDEYEITELNKGKDGKYKEKVLSKIKGSHLVSDYNGKDKNQFLKIASKGAKPIISYLGSNGKPSLSINARALSYKNNVANKHHDPMAVYYDIYSLNRKRKDKKLPYYMSSTESYREHKYGI